MSITSRPPFRHKRTLVEPRTLATQTSEGYIPHLRVKTPGGLVMAPVKLQPNGRGKIVQYNREGAPVCPPPMRRDGRLVFALPGGAEVLG